MTAPVRAEIDAGRTIPGFALRIAVVLVACAAPALAPPAGWIAVIVLAVVGAVVPRSMATWGALIVVGLALLSRPEDAGDWRPYLVLLVVHLLHVIGGLTLVVPSAAQLQVRALRRPLVRFLVVQAGAQIVLAATLFGIRAVGRMAGLAGPAVIVAAVCACAAVVLLVALAARR